MKWWLDKIDEVYEEKYGDTDNLNYENWRRHNQIVSRYVTILVVAGVILIIISELLSK